MQADKLHQYRDFLKSQRPIDAQVLNKIEHALKGDFIYHSNAIEGNTLTRRETDVILEYGVTVKGKPLKDHLEVKGQEYALAFLGEEIQSGALLNIMTIRDFHRLIMGGTDPHTAGVFKKMPNFIIGATFETSSPLHTEEDISRLIKHYIASDEDLIDKIAKFHADFEKIHPFSDGNGRTGRLIMNLELMKADYPICIIKNEDRLEYYDSLQLAQQSADYSAVIAFVRKNVARSFEFYFKYMMNDWKMEFQQFIQNQNSQ